MRRVGLSWTLLAAAAAALLLLGTTQDVFDAVVWLIAVVPVVNWAMAAILVVGAWPRPRVTSLVERAVVAVLASISSTLAALLALNRTLGWGWNSDVQWPLLLVAILLVSAPAVYWFHLYINGRFGAE